MLMVWKKGEMKLIDCMSRILSLSVCWLMFKNKMHLWLIVQAKVEVV